MKQKLLNSMKLRATLLVAILCSLFTGTAWGDTKTEGFETKDAGNNYQSKVTISTTESDCGISWEMYYGTVSTSSKITGNNSVALRLYTTNNYGYLKTTTPIEGLSNVSLKAKAATSNSASIKVDVSYSADGTNWTAIESNKSLTSSAETYSFDIPSGGKYFQIAISSSSTKPSTKNAQLTIDDVVFTYSSGGDTPTTYTVTYDANGGTGTMTDSDSPYEEGDEVTLLDNTFTAPSGKTWSSWAVTDANSQSVAVSNGKFIMPASDVTVTAQWANLPAYTVTLGDNSATLTESTGGAGVTLPSRDALNGYEFAGWSETNVSEETTTAPTIIPAGTYYPSANITLYPVYTKTGGGATPSAFSVGDTGDFAIVSAEQGGKYYALPTSPTVSSGKITAQEITVSETGGVKYVTTANASGFTWTIASATNGYTLSDGSNYIYHSNGGASGTNLTYGNGTSYTWALTVDGDYITMAGMSGSTTNNRGMLFSGTTIGGYSLSNATASGYYKVMILPISAGSTTYYWSSPVAATVETPVITVGENPFLFSTTATITCATTGATIYYTTDGNNPTTSSSVYSTAIPLTATTTIKAFAVSGNDESTIASVTANKNLAEPTVTVSGELTLDLDGGTNVSAGTLTASVTYNNAAVPGATVTWESSAPAVATIDESTGAVTLLTTGTVTFTATYAGNSDYASATGTKTISVVDSNVPGSTAENPYTVAQAITAIQALPDNNATSEKYYISGIVSAFYNDATGITSASSKRYYISDDGLTNTQLLVYNGKGLNNVAFSSDDELLIGDRVVIYGPIQKFSGNTPEIASGNYLYSRVTKLENTITVTGGTSFTIDRTQNEEDLTLTATATSETTVTFTVDTDNTTISANDYELDNGYLLVSGTQGGVIIIKANAAGNATYKDADEVTITVTVVGVKSDAIIAVTDDMVTYGNIYTVDENDIDGGAITLSSSNTAVATVSGLTITPVAVGSTTITVNTAEDETYKAGTATFTLTVLAPEGKTTAATGIIFNDTFDYCEGTGGNKTGTFSNGSQNSALKANSTGGLWTNINSSCYPANGCVRFGTNSDNGTMKMKSLAINGSATLTFNAAGWSGSATNTLAISATGATISGDTNITLENAKYNSYEVNITEGTGTVFITFSGKRGFIDDVTVSTPITATLNASGYTTFCSEYPLDFTDSETNGYSAWQITGVSGTTITFSQVTGRVKGGTGLLLKGTAGETVTIPSADSDNTLSSNKLYGTLAPTYVAAETYYGLKGDKFVKVNAGTAPAGKALLPASAVGGDVKGLSFVFEATDGIVTMEDGQMTKNNAIFNLAGQRLQKMQRGINIVNGKKVLVK